jgi:hypothetical protein
METDKVYWAVKFCGYEGGPWMGIAGSTTRADRQRFSKRYRALGAASNWPDSVDARVFRITVRKRVGLPAAKLEEARRLAKLGCSSLCLNDAQYRFEELCILLGVEVKS